MDNNVVGSGTIVDAMNVIKTKKLFVEPIVISTIDNIVDPLPLIYNVENVA